MKNLCSDRVFQKIFSFIEKNGLIQENDKIIAAVSGGADSVFMLYFLNCAKRNLNFELSVCHFNHKLRIEADSEEFFVKKLAERFGLNFFPGSGDVKAFAKDKGISIEMAARRLRHSFFKKLVEEGKGNKIALAHNFSDSMETFFLNIFRGTGLRGLTGMPAKKGCLIRPVLCLDGAEIRKTLDFYGIAYEIDKSNFEKNFLRNRVRISLIPALQKTFGKGFEKRFESLFKNLEASLKSQNYFIDFFLENNAFADNYGARVKLDFLQNLPDYAFNDIFLRLFERVKGSTYGISKMLLKDVFSFVNQKKTGLRSLFPDKSLFMAKTKDFFFIVKKDFFLANSFVVEKEQKISLPLGFSFVFEKGVFEEAKNKSFCFIPQSFFKKEKSLKVARIDFENDFILFNEKKRDLKNFLKKRGVNKFLRQTIYCLKSGNEILFIPDIAISDTLKSVGKDNALIKVYIKDSLG